ncbi:hypothetical protein EAX62_15800 [Tessaracoccus antarcticus]|uniref:Uncharacterized protein n=1 Tax=Tessaracoccus antarcticus TaxID=2479848 RepID=A0A3M0FYD1_9ACTN|nr:hypothetical protein EAX62_15800 [Tessaracoccus antarcticus]
MTVGYDPGRAARQLIGFGGAALLMLGVGALGVVSIVASLASWQGAGTILGVGIGMLLTILSLMVLVTSAAIFTRIIRSSRQPHPLLSLDANGITGLIGEGVDGCLPWSAITSLAIDGQAPRARRSSTVAKLDAGHRIGQATQRRLDSAAGLGLGMRDGKRWLRVQLVDGRSGFLDLTLDVGPASYARLAPLIAEYVRAQDPRIRVRT